MRFAAAALLAAGVAGTAVVPNALAAQEFDLVYRGSYDPTTRGAEIVTVDPVSQRMFIAAGNRIDIVNVSNVTAPTLVTTIDMAPYGQETTSVSVRNGVVAAASIANPSNQPGKVVFFDINGAFVASVDVGAVPDMIMHSPDGTKLAVANEGEISCSGTVLNDPVGSISIIDLSTDPITQTDVSTATFTSLNGTEAALNAAGVRIIRNGATAEQDLEPESVTWSPDGTKIYSSLQDNNALATVDVATNTVTSVVSFGYLDHSLPENKLDASDRDGTGNNPATNITTWPVMGMFQPDGIGAFNSGGTTYVASANEGDSRGDWSACGGNDEARGADLNATRGVAAGSPLAAAGADVLTNNDKLSRLQVTNAVPNPATGPLSNLYVYGTRSVSLWNANTGARVWDSGSFLEELVNAQVPTFHNAGVGKNAGDGYDTRSDNKGPEPEGLVVGQAAGRTLLFVGLERANGIAFWDVTNPNAPQFQEWERSQVVFDSNTSLAGNQPAGDLAPEGLFYVPADQSWTGRPLLFVAHEADQPGTTLPTRTSIYELNAFGTGPDPVIPEVPVTVLLSLSTAAVLFGGLAWTRRRAELRR
jgi:YVTN family beta-propeller protein